MFVSFDPLTFLFWLTISSLIPGALISFSILRKDEDFLFIEKLFIGFALGVILLPLIPFLAYFVLGLKYTYQLTLASIGLLYVVALIIFAFKKTYEDLRIPTFKIEKIPTSALISVILIVLIAISYLIRLGSYSPVFQELDPYFYTYVASQILSFGENPTNDGTAWVPEVNMSHRTIPALSYLEAGWYSLYTGGSSYDNMMLAVIASMYPPLAAALFVFFVYLLVSVSGKREWGLFAAGLVAFAPVLVYKLSAGEQEIQPYAFFSLAFFYAMYALSMKKNDLRFSALAGLGFAAVALGSGSQLLALVTVMIFTVVQSVLLFLRDDEKEFIPLLKTNATVFVLGPLLGSMILKDLFSAGSPSLIVGIPFLACTAFAGLLYLVKQKISDRSSRLMVLGAIVVLGLIIYLATPVGTYIRGVALSGFEITRYNTALDRTIAEQGLAGNEFGDSLGFMAETYQRIARTALWPLVSLVNLIVDVAVKENSPKIATLVLEGTSLIVEVVGLLLSLLFFIFSFFVNVVLQLSVLILDVLLGTDVSLPEKANSLMLFWIFLFWVALVYSFLKKESNLFVLFLAIVMPPLIVGIIKAKYTIYAAAVLAIAAGFSFGALGDALSPLWSWLGQGKKEVNTSKINHILLGIAALLVIFQFAHGGFSPSLLWGAFQPLYQNDPAAIAPKFQEFCEQNPADAAVCAAAADPRGYANQGTNYQYDERLCMLSVFSNYSYYQYIFDGNPENDALLPPFAHTEAAAAMFKCQRISDYWISSMEWLKNSTEPDARVISWWDYGHWINYFGERNTVLRNEHASHGMIGATAHAYVDGSPEDLKEYMKAHDSEYALFDMEIVAGSGGLGGKYGALNYLSCDWDNKTNVSRAPGQSECEADHLWETIFVSSNPCILSSLTNKTGWLAYEMYEDVYEQGENGQAVLLGTFYRPYYPPECTNQENQTIINYCRAVFSAVPTYCLGEAMLADGSTTYATYELNETYPNGDLKLNKAQLEAPYLVSNTVHLGNVTGVTLLYTNAPMWLENGEVKSGYEDRKGKFYDSNIYRAIFLNSLPGFTQVYSTPGSGAVKIYKIAD